MQKRIISVILVVLMLLSFAGCGGAGKYIFVEATEIGKYSPFGEKGSLVLENTEGLEAVSENEYLQLYYNKETYVVTVFDKRTGKSYTTNPAQEVPGRNNTKLALLNLMYSDSQGKTGTIDSYTQSVLLDQVKVEKKGDAVTFVYSIGDVSDGLEVTPSIIGDKRFNELLEKADASQKKILKRRYSYIKDYNSWSRRKIVNPASIEELVKLFKDLGYTAEDLQKDNEENGVSGKIEEKLSFVVPLTFRLDGDSVVAEIELERVEYPSNKPLVKIEMLPYFGAVDAGANGYFLLPDGSGSIMNFDTVASGAESYESPVYGKDAAMRITAAASYPEDIVMPVFGACYNENGFLCVIEQGEALADILAFNSGSTDNYSKIYSRLNFLKTESVALGDQGASDNFNYYHFQEKCYSGKYTLRYILLEKENCGYNGMAAGYRNYLISTGGMVDNKLSGKSPFVLETVGGILSDKSFLGFQYKGITALTGYEDNAQMAKQLSEKGVGNISVRLTAFSGDGLQNLLVNKAGLIGELGGDKGLKSLKKLAESQGFKVYPDYEYLTFSVNSSVFDKNSYAIQSMDLKDVKLDVLNPVTLRVNTQIEDNAYYLTAIGKLSDIDKAAQKQLDKYGFKQMSLADMGHSISSDFTPDASYDRQSASNYAKKLVQSLSGKYDVMLSGANVANAQFASIITDAPLWSSQYEFTESVPFYSMVYHGLVDYTGEAVNLSADAKKEFLRCIEYGASLKYTLIYKNKSVIKNSDYTHLYSAGFEDNLDKAAENYKSADELYAKTADAYITEHKKLAPSVYYTGYSNGVYTVVNYSQSEYTSDYGVVPAEDYIISGQEMEP